MSMCTTWQAAVALSLAAIALPGWAAALPRLNVDMHEAKLENGLRVILVEDRTAPIITVAMMYDVGSANEQEGRSGFAHLFEHLMFQGSEHVKAGEHMNLIERYGGNANATTNTDWTFYFEGVPANQLDLVLFLESDRLRSLNISEANLKREIEVVKEERRMRVDNQPYRRGAFALEDLLYDSFAYGHEGVGSMADLDAATLQDVQSFFDTYYRPSNAVLILVGDFENAAALAKVRNYFGPLPTQPVPAPADRTEPSQSKDRRAVMHDQLAPLPRLDIAFKAVPGAHDDYFALTVLSSVLQEGRSSRLYEALVKQQEIATDVRGTMDERRGVGALKTTAMPRDDSSIDAAEQGIYREIERLQREPVADWEMEKAKNQLAAQYLSSLQRGVLRALVIGATVVDFGDVNRINTYLDRIAAVTKDDIQRVAKTHLREGNRTVLVTLPAAAAGEGAK
ncbi:MAG: M16 family metallopeptidase [Steroidobacteraceae bacterium]